MKKRMLPAILLIVLLAPGCVKPRTIDSFGYILAVGFDLGEQLPYQITLMLQKTGGESKENQKSGFELISAECGSLYEAIDTLTASLPFQLDFARTSMFVFSVPLLTERRDAMEELTDVSFPRLRIRDNVHLFVSLGTAYDALKGFENAFDANISKLQTNFIAYSREMGLIPTANLAMLAESKSGKTFDIVLPVIGVSEKNTLRAIRDCVGERRYSYIGGQMLTDSAMKSGISGSALFCMDQLVGILDGQNTQLLLMTTGEFHSGRVRLVAPNGQTVSVYLKTLEKPRRRLTLGASPHLTVSMMFQADVETPQTGLNLEAEELRQWIAASIEDAMPPLFFALREMGADSMGVGKEAVKQFSSTRAWEKFDWTRVYQKMDASFSVTVQIVHNTQKTELE